MTDSTPLQPAGIGVLDALTDEEIDAFDWHMNEHMYQHTISNNINGMSCDPECRRQAIARGFEWNVLKPRRERLADAVTTLTEDPSDD